MSKALIHSYPWYISDWRESETRLCLNLEQRGLFRELVDYCYREGTLPNDLEMLTKIAGCTPEEFERSWPTVRGEFPASEDGRLHNAKVDAVLPKLQTWTNARRENGRKGGRRTYSEPSRLPTSLPTRLPSTEPIANQVGKPSPSPSPSTSTSLPPTPSDSFEDQFEGMVEKLYGRHPKKKNYVLVMPALFAALQAGTPFSVIDSAHEQLCRSADWTKEGGRWAPKLDEWIVDRGWTAVEVQPAEPKIEYWRPPSA